MFYTVTLISFECVTVTVTLMCDKWSLNWGKSNVTIVIFFSHRYLVKSRSTISH